MNPKHAGVAHYLVFAVIITGLQSNYSFVGVFLLLLVVFKGVFELLVVLLQLLYFRLEGRPGARACRELLLQLDALGCCRCKLCTSLFQTCFKALKPFNLNL